MAALAGALVATAWNARANPTCDVAAGAIIYSDKCSTCHSLVKGKAGAVGPSLYGVVGRRPASERGFAYSPAMARRRERWSPAMMDGFLAEPRRRAPGTYMSFSGLKDARARALVICFLARTGARPN